MTNEAFGWLILVVGFIAALGIGSVIAAIVESWLEWRREREERLPEPNCRARVYRRWRVPE
jgi:uncharacterized membrane protein YraQ (UPF0718 family)